jgi:TldD protein
MIALVALSLLAAAPEADPIFKAMEDEIARAKTLSMEKVDKPYYLGAFVNDEDSFHCSASFGALVSKGSGKSASVSVRVRVGTPDFDNTNFSGAGDFSFFSMFRGPSGRATPAEPDYDALRHALWLQFDDGYKKAVEGISKKRAFLETNQVKERPADFAPAKVETMLGPRLELKVDKDRWPALVKKASAVFLKYPLVYNSTVAFRAQVGHQYFVSTDPAKHRFGTPAAQLTVTASTQATDGMTVNAKYDVQARWDSELPTDAEIVEQTEKLAKQLTALAKAPSANEDYSGPVLFSGRAAPMFFLQTIGEPLSHPRDDLGDFRSGRLTDRLGKHVTSKLVTVKDDPTQETWKGKPLSGWFQIDDDGVKPQAITLIDEGVLKTYFMSRVPTKKLVQTNGHSRAGVGSVGNLFVETKQPSSKDELRKKLLEIAKEEDLDYGIRVDDFDETFSFRMGAADGVTLIPPGVAYKVYADGREELVRGLNFKPAAFRVLKDIVAMGDEAVLVNATQRGQRVGVVAPAVLVKILELQKAKEDFEKPPFTARP